GQKTTPVSTSAHSMPNDRGHVRDIEHAGISAHLVVLLDLGAVVDRHVPAAEIDHLAAGRHMGVIKGGTLAHRSLTFRKGGIVLAGTASAQVGRMFREGNSHDYRKRG